MSAFADNRADLLIVGARKGSLGEAVAKQSEWSVCTAGIDEEDMILDVTRNRDIRHVLKEVRPKHILVTAGINIGGGIGRPSYQNDFWRSLLVNTVGAMNVLNEWIMSDLNPPSSPHMSRSESSFVAISSNSAHIARTNSTAYCASKAALSMALRVAGRELKGEPLVYGYELGLLRGTPMTKATEQRFGPAQSRMPGAEDGLDVDQVARTIWTNFVISPRSFNGTMLRIDAGEQ